MKYWIGSEGEARGPYEASELEEIGIGRDTLVWAPGFSGWVAAGSVEELAPLLPPPVTGDGAPPPFEEETPPSADGSGVEYPRARLGLSITLAVLSTLFFGFTLGSPLSLLCSPLLFSVAAVVFSALTSTRISRGDYNGAVRMARMARVWIIVSSVVLGVAVLFLLLMVAIFAMNFRTISMGF